MTDSNQRQELNHILLTRDRNIQNVALFNIEYFQLLTDSWTVVKQ